MRHGFERAQRVTDLLRRHAHGVAGDRRRKRVRDVVPADEAQLARLQEHVLVAAVVEDELARRIEVRAVPRTQGERVAAHLRGGPGVHRDDDGVVEIHDGDVPRPLPREDVPLRRDVALTRAVVIEMVLAHVRHDRDVRAHPECLELEAR